MEFVKLEEHLIGEKMASVGSGMNSLTPSEGILPVYKPPGKTSF
ncbi:MAG: hypothetical protein K1000chlam3_00681, partial [Chlamydiae bacterium]|nr:hypothetical protein [Chlamydiota bacterium]